MKKSLVGFCNNIEKNYFKVKVWANSFKTVSDAEIHLIVANPSKEDLDICEKLQIKTFIVTENDLHFVYHKRLLHTFEFLKQTDSELLIVTDVFDVVFQHNPFEKLDTNNYDLFFTGEGVNVSEEPWNGDVIQKVFGEEINTCRHHEIICSGVIAGKREQLIDLYQKMYLKCESGTNNHNIKDQAALILLIANNQINNYNMLTLNEGWAMHCATSGPTQFFDSWGLRNAIQLRYHVPILRDDGKVYTENGILFDIVHQFNRIPEWYTILTKKYE